MSQPDSGLFCQPAICYLLFAVLCGNTVGGSIFPHRILCPKSIRFCRFCLQKRMLFCAKILLYKEMCILYNILVLYDKNIAQIPCFRVIFTNIYSNRPAVRGVDLLTFAIDDCIIDCEPVHIMNDAFWLL